MSNSLQDLDQLLGASRQEVQTAAAAGASRPPPPGLASRLRGLLGQAEAEQRHLIPPVALADAAAAANPSSSSQASVTLALALSSRDEGACDLDVAPAGSAAPHPRNLADLLDLLPQQELADTGFWDVLGCGQGLFQTPAPDRVNFRLACRTFDRLARQVFVTSFDLAYNPLSTAASFPLWEFESFQALTRAVRTYPRLRKLKWSGLDMTPVAAAALSSAFRASPAGAVLRELRINVQGDNAAGQQLISWALALRQAHGGAGANLTSLELWNMTYCSEEGELQALADTLSDPALRRLRSLRLDAYYFDSDGNLVEAAPVYHDEEGCTALASSLTSLSALQSLSLTGIFWGASLTTAMSSLGSLTALTRLVLVSSGRELGDTAIRALGASLASLVGLRELQLCSDITGTAEGVEGAEQVNDVVANAAGCGAALGAGLHRLKRCRSLHLRLPQVPFDMARVLQGIAGLPLEELDLSVSFKPLDASVQAASSAALAAVLPSLAPTLQKFRLHGDHQTHAPDIRFMGPSMAALSRLTYLRMGNTSNVHVPPGMTRLRDLSLCCGNVGMDAMCTAALPPSIISINFIDCNMDFEACTWLAYALRGGCVPHLQELYVHNNAAMGPRGVAALCAALPPSLAHLGLAGCGIGWEGCQAIADVLRRGQLPRLEALTVSGNGLAHEGVQDVLDAVIEAPRECMQRLRKLELGYNELTPEQTDSVQQAWKEAASAASAHLAGVTLCVTAD